MVAAVTPTGVVSAWVFANPKSRILACPRSVKNRFAGLMSRWTIPLEWAASRRRQSRCRYRAKTPAQVAGQGSLPAESCLPDIPSPGRTAPGARQFREWGRCWDDLEQRGRGPHAGSAPGLGDRLPGCLAEI